ncbi:MAG: VOC family protein [Chitinophagaceae bacterium]|nr:VOC family protein [Chitinophagaceae bacterium]
MKTIYAYLTFNGNCREAMIFYKKCLGGELSFQTIGESPLSETMPVKMKNCILHGVLTSKAFVLMGSDMVSESGLLKGNAVSLVLNCTGEKEIRALYKKLSQGGEQTYPLENTFWNALFGGLTDKYGNTWMLNYNRENNPSHHA